jgi:hypothetical protein
MVEPDQPAAPARRSGSHSVGRRFGDGSGLVARCFMKGAANFARWHVRAAFRLERARVAVVLFREVEERAGLRQAVERLREVAMVLLQLFAAGADIDVGFRIVSEVGRGAVSIDTLRLTRRSRKWRSPSPVPAPAKSPGRGNSM